jgi:hypothetical protein
MRFFLTHCGGTPVCIIALALRPWRRGTIRCAARAIRKRDNLKTQQGNAMFTSAIFYTVMTWAAHRAIFKNY